MNNISSFLEERRKQNLFRKLNPITNRRNGLITINNTPYLDFSSNDYLGLAENEKLRHTCIKILEDYGMGATGSRLISGDYEMVHILEGCAARLKETESSLIFNSGYQANIGIISSVLDQHDVVFADKLVHASILDGIKLSQAKLFRFGHNNVEHLEQQLGKYRNNFKQSLIVTESIFSMDGDKAPLKELGKLKKKYNCLLMVDEAHATGLFGKNGGGLLQETKTTKDCDLIVGTFGKALGGFGAYLACSEEMKSFMINSCRSFIYSTALPLPVIAWNIASIKALSDEPERRQRVLEKADFFRNSIVKLGFKTPSQSQVVPIIIGDNTKTVLLADKLKEAGFWVVPVRPPTVAKGQTRIRVSISWNHTRNAIEELIQTISKCHKTI